ncbi:hypothetical protein AVEN_202924-1 [Araneus ventricosus]|uniref:Uncharacterized protein n=1 Tax=Araneus ventricosus TaxID=182803 RepID=A0A4Y2WQA5_ARAVE|nr:hypothetical protein AVEN_65475-1 [Araneus ventricosus]GBO38798.1 hypothetical protein AVEN_202924-1 [Araneus ventricosus]
MSVYRNRITDEAFYIEHFLLSSCPVRKRNSFSMFRTATSRPSSSQFTTLPSFILCDRREVSVTFVDKRTAVPRDNPPLAMIESETSLSFACAIYTSRLLIVSVKAKTIDDSMNNFQECI